MARTSAISLIGAGALKAELKELYGYVIENVQKETLSSGLKSQAYTGDPAAGSVEFRRFANASSKDYGTARTSGKGDAIKAPPVTVNLDIHREIIEEAAEFDIQTFGIGSLMSRRADEHVDSMVSELDGAFFDALVAAGTAYSTTDTELEDILEGFIQTLETTENEFTRGVPRSRMDIVCSPAFYGRIRNMLDIKTTPNVNTAAEEFNTWHGVRFYSSNNVRGADAVIQARGACALPVVTHQYREPARIPQSNDFSVDMFYDYGVKVLTPDLVYTYTAA